VKDIFNGIGDSEAASVRERHDDFFFAIHVLGRMKARRKLKLQSNGQKEELTMCNT
jgi:hypothetical protein